MPTLPLAYWLTFAFVLGAIVGSFLNVVIWRLPRGRNLSHPGSHCPHCNRAIKAWENIPIVSFLALRAKCAGCGKPISWRYPGVELLTALLFLVLVWRFGPTVTSAAYCLFAAALVAAFFIDLELFLIPGEVNTFALLVGFGLDAVRIADEGAAALLWGWLPRSIMGAAVCAGVFVGIQIFGYALQRIGLIAVGENGIQEAMGGGDVLLARAIGALIPLRLALASFFLAIAVGAVIGVAKKILDRGVEEGNHQAGEGEKADANAADNDLETAEGGLLSGTVAVGALVVVFGDLWLDFQAWLRRIRTGEKKQALLDEEDDFVATRSHIPFGPFMVVGFFLAVFWGDVLIDAYMKWTGLK